MEQVSSIAKAVIEMSVRQWMACFSKFEGTLNDAAKHAELRAVILSLEQVIGIFAHRARKIEC